jgi:DNA-binding NarL/FixJ family response regulator
LIDSKLRVFLAEDHGLVRDGLKAMINAQPDMVVIGEAADGESACEQVLKLGPDVVVMDVSLPRLNGAKATERLRAARPTIRVLAMTFHGDRAYVRQLLDAGAAGYLLKRGNPDEVLRAIRIVARGDSYVDPEVADFSLGSPASDATGAAGPQPQALSEPEEKILRLIACGHTNKSISAQLNRSISAVEADRASALAKLGLRSRAEIVRYAAGHGWL